MTPNGLNPYYKHWFGGWLYDKGQFHQRNYPVTFHMDARICLLLCKAEEPHAMWALRMCGESRVRLPTLSVHTQQTTNPAIV